MASKKTAPSATRYISLVPFNDAIFSYTNGQTDQSDQSNMPPYMPPHMPPHMMHHMMHHMMKDGVLAILDGTSDILCPAGRVLCETSRMLYPPMKDITVRMIEVIDSVTGLCGYIDPASPVFSIVNTPVVGFYTNGTDSGIGGFASEGVHLSMSGTISASGQIRCMGSSTPLDGTQAAIVIDVSGGSFVTVAGDGDNVVSCAKYMMGDRLFLKTTGGGVLTFSTGFGVASNNVLKDGMVFTFVCDGIRMLEQSRTCCAILL